ncbi:heavy metal sensor histidine kinase [Malikia spinosa]|uniref:heavy metal sensor histidine kinase n=1 Tax=Malikia spinosa TaxID=86180 RepID=UPI0027BACC0D|nr:heavy metal sensor histidine kinase [Malikia spinosa]
MIGRLSLTTRLTLLYSLVSALLLLGMAGLTAVAVDRHFEVLDRDTLHDKIELIQDSVAKAGTATDLQRRLDDALQNHPGLFVRVDDAAGSVLYASAQFSFPSERVRAHGIDAGPAFFAWLQGEREFRALSAAAPAHAGLRQDMRIWVALDTIHHAHFISALRAALWLYAGLAAGLSGMLGWWAARTGLAPLRAMKARAQAVTAHKLDQRMPAEAVPVEMADLAHSLNEMLERLQRDFQRLSEFSSDLAHELRTPISNLLTQTQVALAQPRDAAAYREILASNAEEFQRLARMVSDMLLLAKAEHGLLLPRTEPIDLADEVRALFDFYEALAEEKQIELRCSGTAVLSGDRLMLRRAISNLLSNALRHTPPCGRVEVVIESRPSAISLQVENSGSTIAPELLPRLFDRFFRADKSRAHPDTEGAGLGLAITQAIVQAHGGQAAVTSAAGWTCFTLRFPLS